MQNKIKHIIFDFGNVLFNIDIEGCINRLENLLEIDNVRDNIPYHILQRYEKGEISDETFVWHLQQYNAKVNPAEIVSCWNGMLLGMNNSTVKMLKKLKEDYKLYILSNINGFHARHIDFYMRDEMKLPNFKHELFDQVFYSHEIRMRKPENRIYTYLQEKIDAPTNTFLFIDDLAENVNAAKLHGWNAIQHKPELEISQLIDSYLTNFNL